MSKLTKVVQEEVQKVEDSVSTEVSKVEEEFTQSHAVQVLINAAKVAQKRGAFEIEETEIILKAIKMFIQKTV